MRVEGRGGGDDYRFGQGWYEVPYHRVPDGVECFIIKGGELKES